MTKKRHAKMMERINLHGRQLLAIFPNATVKDPEKLCTVLHRLEKMASKAILDLSNGVIDSVVLETILKIDVRPVLKELLQSDRVFVNTDPRGYALKVELNKGEFLYTDMGGYGVIAPAFENETD
jgi:hypothetical protein